MRFLQVVHLPLRFLLGVGCTALILSYLLIQLLLRCLLIVVCLAACLLNLVDFTLEQLAFAFCICDKLLQFVPGTIFYPSIFLFKLL